MKTSQRMVSATLLMAGLLIGSGCGSTGSTYGSGLQPGNVKALQAQSIETMVSEGNAVKLLMDGPAIFDSINDAIAKAEHSVQIHAFMLGGQTGMRIVNTLAARRQAGVEVQVLLDPNLGGGGSVKQEIMEAIETLKKVGIPYRMFKLKGMPSGPNWLANLGLLDHSKILVVDGRVSYVGGMNFYDDGAANHDYMVRIEGPASTQVGEMTNADWRFSGAEDGVIRLQSAQPAGRSRIEISQNSPRASNIRSMLAKYFDQAQKKIWIEVLFLDDDTLIKSLVAAKKRGVDVRVILDPIDWGNHVKELDHVPFNGIPNWSAVKECLDAQIPVRWFTPEHARQNLHAKIANVDDRFLITGSANFTYRALDRNRETTVAVEAPQLAQQFGEAFLIDEAKGKRIGGLSKFQRTLADLFDRVKRGIYNPALDLPEPGVAAK